MPRHFSTFASRLQEPLGCFAVDTDAFAPCRERLFRRCKLSTVATNCRIGDAQGIMGNRHGIGHPAGKGVAICYPLLHFYNALRGVLLLRGLFPIWGRCVGCGNLWVALIAGYFGKLFNALNGQKLSPCV